LFDYFVKPMITVENLSKKYGAFEAVKDISFSVGREQVLGFLGPNGAGKTTIMKILTGYHFPSHGRVEIDGISLEESPVEIKKRIGYLPEANPLYGDLTPEEYLDFVASARLIQDEEKKKALDSAIAACGLEGVRRQRIDSLSKGYRQRVGLAQAIIHDPPILILDEPTSGLDPNQIIEIRSLIRELGKRKTVILSTHILQEVEAVCSTVLILNEGRIAGQGTTEEIAENMKIAQYGLDTWELYLKGAKAEGLESRLALAGRETGEVKAETQENGLVRLAFNLRNSNTTEGGDAREAGANYALDGELIFDWAVSRGYKIIGMNRKKLSLEDIFVKLTSESGSPLSVESGEREA
jgi:ABC-2 type transport system ATP-binding protein